MHIKRCVFCKQLFYTEHIGSNHYGTCCEVDSDELQDYVFGEGSDSSSVDEMVVYRQEVSVQQVRAWAAGKLARRLERKSKVEADWNGTHCFRERSPAHS